MNNKDQLLGDQFNWGLNNMNSHLAAQMVAPFHVLSNFYLNAVNLQTDVVRLMKKESKSKNEHGVVPLDSSRISSRVYSILQQKAQTNEIEDYITKLVEQDLDKKEEATVNNLFDTLREEVLCEIHLLKQQFASSPAFDPNGAMADHANDLRDSVTKLDKQKLDKEEFQTLLNTLRREFFDQIKLLKHELAVGSVVPANPNQSNPEKEHAEKANDLKEGQLLENDQVKGTIKEVIDVDF